MSVIRTFVEPQDATHVGVLTEVPDMGYSMKSLETEPAADAMTYDGVLPETLVLLIEA